MSAEIEVPAGAVEQPRIPPPRVAIDWSASRLTAGLVCAIARAQADIQPVGKASRNDQGAGGRGYDYASADDMLAEYRRAFTKQGLATVFASTMADPPNIDIGENQSVTCTLKIEAAVMHADDKGEVGVLVVRGEQDAIGSRGRPPDKAQRAAETYALGFIARDLGCMNRTATPDDEDNDKRDDSSSAPRRGPPPRRDEPRPQRTVTPARVHSQAPAAGSASGDMTEKQLDAAISKVFKEIRGIIPEITAATLREEAGVPAEGKTTVDQRKILLRSMEQRLKSMRAAMEGDPPPDNDPEPDWSRDAQP